MSVSDEQLSQWKERAESETQRYKGLQGEKKVLDKDFMELLREPKLNLSEKKVGKYEVKIETVPANTDMTVVSMRNWMMMGYKQLKVTYLNPRPLYKLLKDGQGLLMSDSPQEMFLQYEAYKNSHGKVLVGGLGLGLYVNMISRKDEVTEIVVVEIEKDVIKLCRPRNKKVRVVCDDIWNFLKTTEEKFDYAYIDIHYSTGCMEYIYTVLPMRKIFEERFPGMKSYFWGEEEMKSQYDPDFEKKNEK